MQTKHAFSSRWGANQQFPNRAATLKRARREMYVCVYTTPSWSMIFEAYVQEKRFGARTARHARMRIISHWVEAHTHARTASHTGACCVRRVVIEGAHTSNCAKSVGKVGWCGSWVLRVVTLRLTRTRSQRRRTLMCCVCLVR